MAVIKTVARKMISGSQTEYQDDSNGEMWDYSLRISTRILPQCSQAGRPCCLNNSGKRSVYWLARRPAILINYFRVLLGPYC
jgi:hypothetical protein